MTIRYNQAVATVRCGGFLRLLFRWNGSIYKLLWFELSIFLGCYAALSLSYHFLMPEPSKRTFENIAQYCNQYSNLIPISFVLGFYVQRVMSRYWEQFSSIPWPNRMAIYVSTYIQSNDERGRMMRRTIMRYLCLGFIMTMSSISPQIKRRFPTLTHMREAGFLMANEQLSLESVRTTNNKYFVPFIWATSIVAKARKEGMIKSDIAVQRLVSVVSLAVYIFSLSCLLGRYQFDVGSPAEKHFPFFTILQFVFYMGWLKVAETLLSPFGEDDDDFDINLLVDRYLHESYMVVDEMFMKAPDILKDQHWDVVDFEIPYTAAAALHKKDIYLGSATGMEVPVDKQAFVPIQTSHIDLRQTSSTMVSSSHNLRSKKAHKVKKASILAESTESKESMVVVHGTTSNVKGRDATVKPVSQDGIQQSTTAVIKQAVELKPSTTAGEQPSVSSEQQPSTSDGPPGTISGSTVASQPEVVTQQEVLTQRESNLIAKIHDELKELRSK